MNELNTLSLDDIAKRMSTGEITSVRLVEAFLERIAETEPHIHAYAHVGAEQALAAARKADAESPRGPLHGVPFAVKDVVASADMPTEANSRLLRGHRPEKDAWVIQKLRAAGAILIGKHVTHEFATGQDEPPSRNPWNLACYPGGSSAGGGASTAARSCQFALGTDAGGSVRVPAAVTGVVGLKPTFGRIGTGGHVRGASVPTVGHIGILSRRVRDAMHVLNAVAGEDPADPTTWLGPVPDYPAAPAGSLAGMRLGVPDFGNFGPAPDAPVAKAFARALDTLRDLGADLVGIEIDRMELAVPAATAIITAEIGFGHEDWINTRPHLYHDAVRQFLELSIVSPANILQAAYRARHALQQSVAAVFRRTGIQAIVTPTFPALAMPLAELDAEADMVRLIQYTCPWSLVGQPAISIPCGFSEDNLPVGLQIVGAPLDEMTVCRVACAFETATDWHERQPPL